MPKVNEIVGLIENIAKPEYAYEWDNCGLVCGSGNSQVKKVLVTLDITAEVAKEAADKKCEMIISHHPLIFRPIKNVNTDTYEGEVIETLYKNGIALYCAHTSLDIASGGVNDALAETLGLKNIGLSEETDILGEKVSCGRRGEFEKEITKEEFLTLIKEKTGAETVLYSGIPEYIKTVSLCTGAGEDMAFSQKKTDVFITGEVKYHTALELKRQKIAFIAIGHYFSEIHIVRALYASLQKCADMLQYSVEFIPSKTNTNPFDC